MKHYNVAVLRGGPSSEHEVSMKTGAGVLAALRDHDLRVTDIIINKQGEWMHNGFVRSPLQALAHIDVVFIALHGSYGEDGAVQRLLESLSIPYTGSRPFPSAVAMNKLLTKETLKGTGLKFAPHLKVTRESTDLSRVAEVIDSLFGPAYVVKPITGGSSIDTYLIEGTPALIKALTEALAKYEEVLVEQRIFGREATVGVINGFRGQQTYRLPAIEIVPAPSAAFFDYNAKYDGSTDEICPGRFSKSDKQLLEDAAHLVHETLGLSQYSRSDFIVAHETDAQEPGIYFLEVNTLPGLTTGSLLPKALDAVGCRYNDFILHLLEGAFTK